MAPIGMDDEQQELVRREAGEPQFRSAAARWEYERARRMRVVLRLVAGVGLLVVCIGLAVHFGGSKGGDGDHGESGSCAAELNIDPIGSPLARVKVNCILPSKTDCHSSLVVFLTEVAKARPDKFRVDFTPLESYKEDDLKGAIGSYCAAVMINGKTQHDVVLAGRDVTVSLVGTIPSHYSFWELGEALQTAYVQTYGPTGEVVYSLPEGAGRVAVSSSPDGGPAPAQAPDLDFDLPDLGDIELKE